MKTKTRTAILLITSILLASCGPPKQGTAIDDINKTINSGIADNEYINATGRTPPPAVSAALLPAMSIKLPAAKKSQARRFNVSVQEVAAKTFFMGLVEGTSYNMVVSPKVSGKISLDLKKVTIDEVMQTVENIYGYEYRRTASGYEVLPNQLQTRLYTLNYLDIQRAGTSQTEASSGQISQKIRTATAGNNSSGGHNVRGLSEDRYSGSSVETKSKTDFWKGIEQSLKMMVGKEKGRSVIVNPQAGLVLVKAYPKELRQVAHYLDSIEGSMARQVIIEAKILEVNLNQGYEAGIDWNVFKAIQTANNTFVGVNINAEKFTPIFTGTVTAGGDFSAVLKMLGTQGNVQVLSSPRISALNNQKAVIKVGEDEFFVTGVSSSVTTTGSSETPTQDVELTPFFSGITLDVTPQISRGGDITLHVHPSVSEVKDQNKQISLGNQNLSLPLALSSIRESDSVVHAKNGQVIVIGGLMITRTTEDIAETPIVGRIPVVGGLFRHTKQQSIKSELVILLRPIVIGAGSWTEKLVEQRNTFKKLNKGFHIGGRPDVFGTQGEADAKAAWVVENG